MFYAHLYQGAMTFGAPGKEGARVHDLKDVEAILDVFLQHGHREIDSARTYCGGTSEEYLGQINWQEKGLLIETKLSVRAGCGFLNSVSHCACSPVSV
jgi:aflatoxin B1 aldehyde reductase